MSDLWPTHFSAEVVADAFGPPLCGYTVALEAWRRGMRVTLFDSKLGKYEISDGRRKVRFDKSRPSLTSREAIQIEQDKARTAAYLREAGVPVPRHWHIDPAAEDAEEALLRHAAEGAFPMVLKPVRGSMGRNVYTGIENQRELVETFRYMRPLVSSDSMVLLEEHFDGDDYRVLVVGDRASAVCLRLPANVTGDGRSSVRQLIEQKNQLRLGNPYLCRNPITPDRETDQHLQRLGYDYDSVPPAGERVLLRSKANASQGGDTIDQTAVVPQAVKDAAVQAVAAVPGLAIAGVDVLFNHRRSPVEDSFRVIELNSRPEVELNMYPSQGPGQDVPEDVIDVFFPGSRRWQDPSVATLGLNLELLLAPLRSASADQVLVKKRPKFSYPVRRVYQRRDHGPLSLAQQNAVLLDSRRAGIAGWACAQGEDSRVVVCGTEEQVQKFLRLASTKLSLDPSSVQNWDGLVIQGFQFQTGK